MIKGTFNQIVKASGKFGGALVVFEGKPELLIGGFNFNLEDLPAPGDVLPCGTPVNCDESTRVITPIITGKVVSINGTAVTLKDLGFGQTAFKVGSTVAILGSDLSAVATKYATIASKDGNVITLSAAIEGLAADAILVEVDATSKKIKAIPNALTPYDIVRDANAIAVDGDGAYKNDRPVLERRMPAINDAIKAALVAAGCQFKWSNRK